MKVLKWLIVIGFVLLVWLFIINESHCQTLTAQEKILTEISVDIKYIKDSIADIRHDGRELKLNVQELDRRVLKVESKTDSFEGMLCDITERNNWFMGIIGAMLIAVLGLQYKRSNTFRNGNGKPPN